ncbi:Protein FAM63B [Smittium culicis]|uniref:Protein FAM63B n=1 Tax=Smittium culicis TaxID=133412 RepID=A0A1R1XNS3_9FUNG|nr:Protein FAM63B [Smittium culicis]
MSDTFKLKNIKWSCPNSGSIINLHILTQNENGPCPLIAIANTLVLQQKITIPNNPSSSITTSELVEILTQYLLALKKNSFASTSLSDDNPHTSPKETDFDLVISELESLKTGLNVNVQFDNIRGFGKSSQATRIFETVNLDFVHGWVIDPIDQSQLFNLVVNECSNNYEAAVDYVFKIDSISNGQVLTQQAPKPPSSEPLQTSESDLQVAKAVQVNDFLNSSSTQVTYYGLNLLMEALPNDHFAVFFRNNHFNTLYKRGYKELFVLCTDESLANDERICWETLNDIFQLGSTFVDSFFKVLETDSNVVIDKSNTDKAAGDKVPVSADLTLVKSPQTSSQEIGGSRDYQKDIIDSDYALALSLQESENRRSGDVPVTSTNGGSSAFRDDFYSTSDNYKNLPLKFDKSGGQLYGVPVASPLGTTSTVSKNKNRYSTNNSDQDIINRRLRSSLNNTASTNGDESYFDSRYEQSNMDYLQPNNNKKNNKHPPKKEESSGCIIS